MDKENLKYEKTHNSCQEVATILRSRKEEIIERWVKRVLHSVPAAPRQSRPALIDSMGDFIENLAKSLEQYPTRLSAIENVAIAKEHGEQRATLVGYNPKQLVTEYGHIRYVIMDILETEYSPVLDARMRINDFIDQGIRDCIDSFLVANEENILASRERFVTMLSHDLRTPLSAASFAAQMLLKNLGDMSTSVKAILRIRDNLDRMDQMIRDLLDASLIRAGHSIKLEMEECNINQIIQDTVEDLATIHGDRFVFRAHEVIKASCNVSGVKRIIENLCSNAVKYGSKFDPITISLLQTENQAMIHVHNKGSVISPGERLALFEDFRRSESAQSSGEKGWGLGLALVRGLAQAHGGSVELQSSAEEGTTFTVCLPLGPIYAQHRPE